MLNKLAGILDYRHSFYEFMRKLLWVCLVNLLFILTSIPIFTIGASFTAMYSVLQKLVREREFSLIRDYFLSFIRNFGKATTIWLVCLLVSVICYIDITFFLGVGQNVGNSGYVLLGVAIIITLVFLLFFLPVFPILAEFEGSVKDTLMVLRFMVKKHLKQCIWAVVSTIIIMGFSAWILAYRAYLFIYFPIISIGLNSFILTYIYDSALRPYYEEDEELSEYDESEEE